MEYRRWAVERRGLGLDEAKSEDGDRKALGGDSDWVPSPVDNGAPRF